MKQLQKLCSAAIYSAILLVGSGQVAVANTIPDELAAMDSGSLFYLVVNYPPQGDVRNALAQNLQTLIGDDFQEQLPDKNFYSLPKPVKKMWRVKLGLAEPEFANGYR